MDEPDSKQLTPLQISEINHDEDCYDVNRGRTFWSVLFRCFNKMDESDSKKIAPLQVPKINIETDYYDMNRKNRGRAIVLNHKRFNKKKYERAGAETDKKNVIKLLDYLQFTTTVAQDFKKNQIEQLVYDMSQKDHSDYDCFLLIVMTHGEKNKLYAKDYDYDVNTLWKYFTPDNCPSLAGKPKIFFINACRGGKFDPGTTIQFDFGESIGNEQKLPTMADFLIAYSTYDGYVSWRSPDLGSWYIEALCTILQEEAGNRDLLSVLTRVNKKVAFGYRSNDLFNEMYHGMKQIPIVTTTLTKDVFLKEKSDFCE